MAVAALWSCDSIDEDKRWGEWKKVTPQRNVLVEDFTGQNCSNCPAAARNVEILKENLLKVYDDSHVICVSIHGGPMAISEDASPLGLGNQLGDDYNNLFGVTTWPTGMVDRVDGLLQASAWTSYIMDQLIVPARADLKIVPSYDAAKRELTVTVDVTSLAATTASVQVWLTESGIKSIQAGFTGGVYTHNHVLRASMNGLKGDENVTLPYTKTYTYTLPEKWVAENMAVVAFAYDADGVMQTEEVAVIN